MRIPSGKVDQVIYFVAVDVTDLKTRETALSGFTVYRSRNGGAATVYTTPTVAELSAANMPGVYSLLIDEDTTIAAGSDSEEYVVHITQAAMAPVTRSIELYRRDTTTGTTITTANIDAAISSRMASYTQPTGFLAATFPAGTVANTTNITAGTLTTVTTATNVTTVNGLAAGVITAASIAADAITDAKVAADVTIASVTGAVGSVTGAVGSVTGAVGSVTGAVGSVTGNVGGNVVGSVASVTAGVTLAANAITAAATAADFGAEVATAVWTDTTAGDFTVALSVGKSVMNGVALGTGLTINAYTGNTVQTGDSFARIGVAGAGLTNIDLPNQTMDIIGNITGNLSGSVGSVTGAVGSVTGAVGSVTGAVGSVTGNVGGNVVGSVGTVNALAANVITAASMAADASAEIADQVWDEAIAGHLGVGSTGAALNAAGSAGDPWTTALPGAYGAGTAGKIIGDNINAPIATVDTVVDAIKAKTDSLTFTKAGEVDSNIQSVNDVTVTGNGAPGTEWGP